MNIGTITFLPIVPQIVLLVAAGLILVMVALAFWRGLSGWPLRCAAGLALLAALANPVWKHEQRDPLSDVAIIVVDETSSQTIAPRTSQSEAALEQLTQQMSVLNLGRVDVAPFETRIVRVGDGIGPDADRGSRVLSALQQAASEIAPDRLAGAIVISDGQISDAEAVADFPAPVHHLLTGLPDEWDRRTVLETAPAFAIVGEPVVVKFRVESQGADVIEPNAKVPVFVSVDGAEPMSLDVRLGESVSMPLELAHAGANVIQLLLADTPGELTAENNQAVIAVNGVRDRLRVLLVSGEPYAGERTWRNLLKADSAVDLVHFTILRPPSKQDGVPVFELSLIAFPTRELFMDKIKDFDLIIFDKYRNRDVLPNQYLENVVKYVREGGALLVTSGPAFAGVESLYRSPLGEILPAEPTGQVLDGGYVPRISELGRRHPVTQNLEEFAPRPSLADGTPGWGRWFRLIETDPLRGFTVMTGPQDQPLLVLDRVGEGRVAQLGSDQAWLWSRGYEGGGPQLELLRRLAHWLMKEPELEEETLAAEVAGSDVTVSRRSMGDGSGNIDVTFPDGSLTTLPLQEVTPGYWSARFSAVSNGLYRVAQGDRNSVVAVGPAVPIEFVNAIATDILLAPLVNATGGGTFRLSDGIPGIRLVGEGRVSAGRNWLGLAQRNAYDVTGISLLPLAPAWLMLALVGLFSIAAWRVEGR